MAFAVLVVAVRAQWRHLPVGPLFFWAPIARPTVVTVASRLEPAVDTGPGKHLLVAPCEHLHGRAGVGALLASMQAGLRQIVTC